MVDTHIKHIPYMQWIETFEFYERPAHVLCICFFFFVILLLMQHARKMNGHKNVWCGPEQDNDTRCDDTSKGDTDGVE